MTANSICQRKDQKHGQNKEKGLNEKQVKTTETEECDEPWKSVQACTVGQMCTWMSIPEEQKEQGRQAQRTFQSCPSKESKKEQAS